MMAFEDGTSTTQEKSVTVATYCLCVAAAPSQGLDLPVQLIVQSCSSTLIITSIPIVSVRAAGHQHSHFPSSQSVEVVSTFYRR